MKRVRDEMGLTNAWVPPIKARIDMLSTGIRTPIGIKVFGKDLAEMERLAREIDTVVKAVPGTTSAFAERITGGFYLDILKDRLYTTAPDSRPRRSAQSALWHILQAFSRLMAPILAFTAEEVWQFMPEALTDGHVSVHLAGWPDVEVSAAEAGDVPYSASAD